MYVMNTIVLISEVSGYTGHRQSSSCIPLLKKFTFPYQHKGSFINERRSLELMLCACFDDSSLAKKSYEKPMTGDG
jgi:hypothetical protein